MIDKKVKSLAGEDGAASADTFHKVRITSTSLKEPISAYLPDTVTMTVASDWSAPFAEATEGKLNTLATLFGASLKTRSSTVQTWQGSSPIEVTIPFVLTAESNPRDEIMEPINQLMKLCLPSEKNGRYLPPGPNFRNYLRNNATSDSSVDKSIRSMIKATKDIGAAGERITVQIGKFMYFDDVVMLSVTPTFSSQRLHHTGQPLKAEVEITFRKYTTSVKDDLDKIINIEAMKGAITDKTAKDGIFPKARKKIDDLTKKVPRL